MDLSTVAYIDAGSGSYLLAAIAGGATTAWFFVRSKVDRLTGRRKRAEASTPAPDAASE